MKIVIVEDEVDAQMLLSSILKEYCPSCKLVGIASNPPEAIELIKNEEPDLVFFDIQLEGGDSFQILDEIQERPFKIIFTTAYDEYALKAFKYHAIDYILKPYNPSEVKEALERVGKMKVDEERNKRLNELLIHQKNAKTKITISTKDGVEIVTIANIVRIEAERAYCNLFLQNGERIMISKPLKEIEEIVPVYKFFRSHHSHLINIDFVRKYLKEDGGGILMSDGIVIPLARRRRKDFMDLFN